MELEDFTEDGTENYRSVGVMFRFGAFRFLDLGDLSGNTLTGLACPKNLIGTVSAFLIAHHGDYDSNVPALYAGLRPQVSIMNNGATKGGAPVAFTTLHAQTGMDLWQLHASQNPGAENAPAVHRQCGRWAALDQLAERRWRLSNREQPTGSEVYSRGPNRAGAEGRDRPLPKGGPARRGTAKAVRLNLPSS